MVYLKKVTIQKMIKSYLQRVKKKRKRRIAATEEGRREGVEVEVAQIGRSRKGKRSPYVPSDLSIYLGKPRKPFQHFVFFGILIIIIKTWHPVNSPSSRD